MQPLCVFTVLGLDGGGGCTGVWVTGVSGAVLGGAWGCRMPLGAAGGAFHALFCKVGYFFVF